MTPAEQCAKLILDTWGPATPIPLDTIYNIERKRKLTNIMFDKNNTMQVRLKAFNLLNDML